MRDRSAGCERSLGYSRRDIEPALVRALLERSTKASWLAGYVPPRPYQLGTVTLPPVDLDPPVMHRRIWVHDWARQVKRRNLSAAARAPAPPRLADRTASHET